MQLNDLSHLKKAKSCKVSGRYDGIRACCPAHEDDSPSFCAWAGYDGWIHFNCKAGCTEDAILGALGWQQNDRKYLNGQATVCPVEDAVYLYTDRDGIPKFRKHRYYKDNKKQFYIESANGKQWVKGLLPGIAKGMLYRLPDVLKALDAKETIYICEGEKACDEMRKHGLTATCQPFGAEPKNWTAEHSRWVAGGNVVIIADRDETGLEYGRAVLRNLIGVLSSSLVYPKTEDPKADAYDHFRAGYGANDFVPVPQQFSPPALKANWKTLDEFDEEDTDWLMAPYIPFGGLTMLQGEPGVGKSTVMRAILACLTSGNALPNGARHEPMNVIYLDCEDSITKVAARSFRLLGGDKKRISVISPEDVIDGVPVMPNEAAIESLEDRIQDVNARMVVIGPIVEYLGAQVNLNSATEVRPFFARMSRIAERRNVAFVFLHHVGKSTMNKAIYRAVGTIDIPAAMRSILQVGVDPDDTEIRALAHVKSNWAAPGKSIGFSIGDDGAVLWGGSSELSADRMNEQRQSGRDINPARKSKCLDWLRDRMEVGIPIGLKSLEEEAKENGFSRATLFRARDQLPIGTRNWNGMCEWFWVVNE